MEQQGDLLGIIGGGNTDLIARLRREAPSPQFVEQFSAGLSMVISSQAAEAHVVIPEQVVEREGRAGILPPPVKKFVVREALAGRSVSQLRTYQEVIKGEPELTVEEATVHVVIEVDSTSSTDQKEIETVINTILSLDNLVKKDETVRTATGIRIKDLQSVVHMVQRSAVGVYKLDSFRIGGSRGNITAQEVITTFQRSLKDVLDSQPEDKPSSDIVARYLLGSRILEAVNESQGTNRISVGVLVFPKDYADFKFKDVFKDAPYLIIDDQGMRYYENTSYRSI
ncbi:MAG: hypothetical protein Q7S60_04575 [bacterium]|nr:hypothetical protein [bacterium]